MQSNKITLFHPDLAKKGVIIERVKEKGREYVQVLSQ